MPQTDNLRKRGPTPFLCILSVVIWLTVIPKPSYAQYGYGSDSGPERKEICAKYETANGWSDGYKVSALIIEGDDLNRETESIDYDPLSTYAVIFWGGDQASVLKLDSIIGDISSIETRATDQRGRKWKVSTSDLCI